MSYQIGNQGGGGDNSDDARKRSRWTAADEAALDDMDVGEDHFFRPVNTKKNAHLLNIGL